MVLWRGRGRARSLESSHMLHLVLFRSISCSLPFPSHSTPILLLLNFFRFYFFFSSKFIILVVIGLKVMRTSTGILFWWPWLTPSRCPSRFLPSELLENVISSACRRMLPVDPRGNASMLSVTWLLLRWRVLHSLWSIETKTSMVVWCFSPLSFRSKCLHT